MTDGSNGKHKMVKSRNKKAPDDAIDKCIDKGNSKEIHDEDISHVSRLARKELLESNLDSHESIQQQLKKERQQTAEQHRKQVRTDYYQNKRVTPPSTEPTKAAAPTTVTTPKDPAFSVATKIPDHKRHAEEASNADDPPKLYLYEPAKAVRGAKKKHRPSIDMTEPITKSQLDAATAAAASAASADSSHHAQEKNWPQLLVMAAPAALAAIAVGAGILLVRSLLLKKRWSKFGRLLFSTR